MVDGLHQAVVNGANDAASALGRAVADLTAAGHALRAAAMTVDERPGDLELSVRLAAVLRVAVERAARTAESSWTWLRERASEPFGIDRFRPNLVVSNTAAWEEDTWRTFTVGDVELRAAAPWPRCEIPQIDQTTSDRHREPAKVLRLHRWCTQAPTFAGRFRRILEGSSLFGIGCTIGPPGAILRVGDEVTITTTAPPVLAAPSV